MPQCQQCGESLARAHRTFYEKAIYSLVFKCRSCGARVGENRNFLNYFSPHTRCPLCGTEEVDKRITRDKIDKLLMTPVSILQAVLGGTLYHCVFCRIQFYDLRARARRSSGKSPAASINSPQGVTPSSTGSPAS